MDKVRIVWSDFALDKLNEIGEEIELTSVEMATQVVHEIYNSVSQLEHFPNSGAPEALLDELEFNYKYLVVYSYKVVYRIVDSNNVLVTDVFPCRMDPFKLKKRSIHS